MTDNGSKGLTGRVIVVTRPLTQAKSFIERLDGEGARVITIPMIETRLPSEEVLNYLDNAIKKIESYDWLILTSLNGVKYFFERLGELELDVKALQSLKVCTVGPKTKAAVEKNGVTVDLVAKEFVAEGLLKELGDVKGKRFLFPRAKEAREILSDTIRAEGGVIDVVTAYETVKPEGAVKLKEEIKNTEIDFMTFTSSSAVTNFVSLFSEDEFSELVCNIKVAAIGPVTKETAQKLGLNVKVTAKQYTTDGLIEALKEFYKNN